MQDDSITIVLGLPELRVVGKEETGQEIRVDVEYRRQVVMCPCCGQMTAKVHSISMQTKRDRRLWDKPVYLVLRKRRFCCLGCGKVFTEPDTVCGARRRTSERFRRQLGEEAIDQPVRHVARRERVGEALVRRCFTEESRLWLEAPLKPIPTNILGLDEFSVKKGRVYDTAIADLKGRQVIGVVSGHRQKEVEDFFNNLPQPEKVQVVVMDMHEPFRQAVEMCLPQAKVVADKFHVLMHVHKALDQVRAGLQPAKGRRGELFHARYLLLRASERLTPQGYARLMDVLRQYPILARAWRLKEAFRAWYGCSSRSEAEARLAQWEDAIREDGPTPFKGLLPMLRIWRNEILNYFDYRYTNGFLEGKNNRIKVIKRVAYGYRNRANFRQRILLTNGRRLYAKAA